MRTRQVHLDFHTSPHIEGIGSKFSKENFQKALKAGNVESITVFAKCHNGVCYYPTKVGKMHPHLDFDFTGAMIDAAHEIGVKAPIYIPAGWSELDAKAHPEWICIKKDGTQHTTGIFVSDATDDTPRADFLWQYLCLNDGEYAHYLYELTEEVCQHFKEVDGLFFDICGVGEECYCPDCIKGMKEMGFDAENENDAKEYFKIKRTTFMKKCMDIVKKHHPDATVFFNSGGAHARKPQYHPYQTHFEMEDLPTAWGGYDKLPPRAKFFANSGKPYLGMTGKFHLSWGEFGGFKTKEALKYEVALMSLYGAGASVGDHMHPDGEMEMQTYKNIGYAYDYLEKISPFCYGGENVADVGVYVSKSNLFDEGLTNILLQKQIDYNFIVNNNFENYDVVIFPGDINLDDEGLKALNLYIEKGGKVILMDNALVKDGKFQIDTGLEYIGDAEYELDYIVCDGRFEDVPDAPMLCKFPGRRTKVVDAEVLAEFMTPYFNRTYSHFCGHKNTPYNKDSKRYPAITRKGNVVYLAHSMPLLYQKFGSLYHRNYFLNALKQVWDSGKIKIEGLGAQGRYTLIRQEDKGRYCLNMTFACPSKRGAAEIIEDIATVYNIKVALDVKEEIKDIYLGLTGEKLAFTKENGKVIFTVPELNCHTSVVIEY